MPPMGTVDIGFIRDEAIEFDPCRGPHLEFPPVDENLADMIVHA